MSNAPTAETNGGVMPGEADREATFLRLVGRATDPDPQSIVTRVLGGGWTVTPMFPDGPPDLAPIVEITGAVDRLEYDQQAWELCYLLADAGGFAEVEPDLPSRAYAPPPAVPGLRGIGIGTGDIPESAPVDWARRAIRLPEALAVPVPPGGAAGGAGIRVGHPDTGYTDHPELAGAIDESADRDVISGDDDAHDPLIRRPWLFGRLDSPGHGTSTGSVIYAPGTGSLTGVAAAATAVEIRTVKSVVQVFDGDVAKAVDYARRSGCHVVSMSLGGKGFFGLEAAIDAAVRDGLIVLAAAGNNVGFVVAPARYPSTIAVAATDALDRPWAGSSRGPAVAIAAPGDSVWVADWFVETPPRIKRHTGTSFAVAHVAGVAALWLALHGPDAIRARYAGVTVQAAFRKLIRDTARKPPGWDAQRFGAGIIDAEAVMSAPLPDPATVTPPARLAAVSGPVDQIRAMVPELPGAEVQRRAEALVGAGNVDRFASQIAWMLAEDPAARARFAAGPAPRIAGVAAGAEADPLVRAASPSLVAAAAAANGEG